MRKIDILKILIVAATAFLLAFFVSRMVFGQSVKLPTTTPTQVAAQCLTTVAANAVNVPKNFLNMMVAVIKWEIQADPLNFGYANLSTTGKIAALRKRAMDENILTCLFNFGYPIYLTDYNITVTAGIK